MSLVGCLDSARFVQRESGCGVRQRAAALSCRRLSAVGGERQADCGHRLSGPCANVKIKDLTPFLPLSRTGDLFNQLLLFFVEAVTEGAGLPDPV